MSGKVMLGRSFLVPLVVLVIGTAFARSAADDVFSFSTPGVDVYADGTTVLDGECYALVWVAAGQEFGGFYADSRLKDESSAMVVAIAPLASGGRCRPVTFQITEGVQAKIDKMSKAFGGGAFEVFLLDTRVRDDKGSLVAGKVGKDGMPTAVNGFAKVEATTATRKFSQMSASSVPAGGSSMIAATLPPNCPVPVVSDFRVSGGKAVLKVSDTAPYAQYRVVGAESPASTDYADVSVRRQGVGEGGIEFEVPATSVSCFFRVKCGTGF